MPTPAPTIRGKLPTRAPSRPETPATPRAALASLAPGSPEAEAAADALLLRARRCGLRLARCLVEGARAEDERTRAALCRLAEEIAQSCRYYTESELRRPPRPAQRRVIFSPLPGEGDPQEPQAGTTAWLAALVALGPERLAARAGLTGRRAAVWARHLEGDPLTAIARSLGLNKTTTRYQLRRAHHQVCLSWLSTYQHSLRR